MPEVQPHPDPPSRSRKDSREGSVSAQAAQSVDTVAVCGRFGVHRFGDLQKPGTAPPTRKKGKR